MSRNTAIDIESQKFALTGPKMFGGATLIAAAVVAYTQLATVSYVDAKHAEVQETVDSLATNQAETHNQIADLAKSHERQAKRMKLLVKLSAAQYLESMDEGDRRRGRHPRSSKARKLAEALQLDPNDPLAGIELTEALADEP